VNGSYDKELNTLLKLLKLNKLTILEHFSIAGFSNSWNEASSHM